MIETFDIAGYTRISVDDELDRDNVSIENPEGHYPRLCEAALSGQQPHLL